MRSPVAWWSTTILVAGLLGLLVNCALRPRPEWSTTVFRRADIPSNWRALPIVARATPEVVERQQDAIVHRAALGPFTMTWTQTRYQDKTQFIGPYFCSISGPGVRDRVDISYMTCGLHPDTLHLDAATQLYVLASDETGACAALRRERLVYARAFTPKPATPATGAGIAVAAVLVVSSLARTRHARR